MSSGYPGCAKPDKFVAFRSKSGSGVWWLFPPTGEGMPLRSLFPDTYKFHSFESFAELIGVLNGKVKPQ